MPMTRTRSPHKRYALEAIEKVTSVSEKNRNTAALVACAYALLEVAFQIGRVADNVPLWGPPEERPDS